MSICQDYVRLSMQAIPESRYYQILKAHAQLFPVVKLDHGHARGTPNCCFNNSLMLALANPSLTYVEGVATPDGLDFPLAHAWCVTANGEVVDITWDKPGVEYFGIPFYSDFIRTVALKSRYPSMLQNLKSYRVYECDPEVFLKKIEVTA